jgi:DNA-binding response OmpR family regulator
MHALVIEDDALIAMLIADELRELGFTSVHTASTGEEAVISVAGRCPDLVTSDGHLAAGSGMGAVRLIRASCSVPVICITGDPEHARRSMPGAARWTHRHDPCA